jgi:hypothetical protein
VKNLTKNLEAYHRKKQKILLPLHIIKQGGQYAANYSRQASSDRTVEAREHFRD